MYKPSLNSHHYAFLTVLLWSSAYVFTKVALDHFSVGVLGFVRCAVASLVLLAVALRQHMPLPRAVDVPLLCFTGIVGFSIYILLFNKGSTMLSPTTSCIIISTAPILSALFARLFMKERLSPAGWLAISLAFCGILILTLWDGSFSLSSGIPWMAAAAVAISSYNLLQRKLSRKYSALQLTFYSFLAGTLALAFFLPQSVTQLQEASASGWVLLVFLGVFPSALAYLFWAKALSIADKTSQVTNYMFLTPFLSLLLEYLVIAQIPGAGTFVGGAVILFALFLFSATASRR